MNRYKKSSGSKFQWMPAKNPAASASASSSSASVDTQVPSVQIGHLQTLLKKQPLAKSDGGSNPLHKPAVRPRPGAGGGGPKNKQEPSLVGLAATLNTYLGPKGYTISKSDLSEEQVGQLRRSLTVRPFTGGAGYGAPADASVEYPIYRESPNKIYIPRFFGQREIGPVQRMAISGGDDIDVPFAGSLRPIQVPVVAAYIAAVKPSIVADSFAVKPSIVADSFAVKHPLSQEDGDADPATRDFGGGGLLELPCAFGKTVLSLKIISELKKKTLVIVNKEFLLNQWIERIGQFLPTARVGRIQGPEIDIEDKDIVLGMLQSISMKDYDAKVFESFGLTIIDEVHHISSEVFSKALFKIVSKYMLGLSATMDRKDGTTYVFKQFLGEVVFKGEREEEHNVEVRAIEFVSKDPEFNLVECDFRGNPKYSTMIVKLCDFVERSDFIVRVLRDLIKEQPGAQIMILAHNRSLLTYLHDSIQTAGFATVGYYVGGMKEESLKATEERQVVVATYAMAAEALDIKTLNTLVMVTPKTDIVQSVGRILREKHEKPLVVDIVDKHDVFQNQWTKRRRYYKKCEYTIRMTDSEKYAGFSEEALKSWKLVYRAAKNSCSAAASASLERMEEEGTDSNSDSESDTQKQKGPQKCMVVFQEEDAENNPNR
jgi:superfamily II DNA or RNA helicase